MSRVIEPPPESLQPAVGSVVIDKDGFAWQQRDDQDGIGPQWFKAGGFGMSTQWGVLLTMCGPLLVVHEPDDRT